MSAENDKAVLEVLIEFRDRVYEYFEGNDAQWAGNERRWEANERRWAANDDRLARMDDRLTGRIDALANDVAEFRRETNSRLDRLERQGPRRR